MKWQDFAHLSLEREKNKLHYEPRARSGSIKVRMTVNMVTKMVVMICNDAGAYRQIWG